MTDTLERWSEGFDELRAPDLEHLLPTLPAFLAEIDGRLGEIERMPRQSYSFTTFANTALMWLLIVALLTVTEYVPVPRQPDRAFLRLLGRFFRSCAFLISFGWQPDHRSSWWLRWRTPIHGHAVATLPRKLGTWAQDWMRLREPRF